MSLPPDVLACLARWQALQDHAAETERRLRHASDEGKAELAAEAIAARVRMLEIERGAT